MNIAIRFYTRSGNTEKLAKAISDELNIPAMMKSMLKPLRKVTDSSCVTVMDEEFHCHGSFGPMHKGRPNEDDIAAVKAFAKRITT